MNKSFRILKQKMSTNAQKKADEKTQHLLQEIRQSKQFSQEHLAEILSTKQANISRMERRTDMYISTLRNYIEAMGGKLDIIAKFPEGNVHIRLLAEPIHKKTRDNK